MIRAGVALVAMLAAACGDDLRAPVPGTFGEHVVRAACEHLAPEPAYAATCAGGDLAVPDAPGALVALIDQRPRLVAALDAVVPPYAVRGLQRYLASERVVALDAGGTLPGALASGADALDALAGRADAMAVLARLGTRAGYRPPVVALGARRALLADLDPVLASTLPALAEGGGAHAAWEALVAAAATTLAAAAPPADAGSPERAAALAAKLLLTERADLATEAAPALLVRRDARGIAAVAVAAPFVDADGDGLADVDALGRFVDAGGAPIAAPTPFPTANDPDAGARDAEGRVAAYAYVDVGATPLGALLRDAATWFDPARGTALDLVRGARALQAPLLDLGFGYAQLLGDPNVRDTLDLLDTLLAAHPAATARLVEAMIAASRLGDAHPEAQIAATAPLWDDLMPVLRVILSDQELVKRLLAALEQPATADLARDLRDLMTYADRFDIDPATQAVTGAFATPPDRAQPDTGFNRSVWQRFLAFIAASNGAQVCNKPDARITMAGISYPLVGGYDPCELLEIDNVATFYLQAIAYAKDASGNVVCEDDAGSQVACTAAGARKRSAATLTFKDSVVTAAINQLGGDAFLEQQSTIAGFRRHPTPAALDRLLFLDPTPAYLASCYAPATDADGSAYRVTHAGTVPALEAGGMFDDLRPLVQAFVDRGKEQQLADLLTVLHHHWAREASGGVTWEPLIAEALGGDLVPALVATAPELDALVVDTKPYATILGNTLRYLVNPALGVAGRQGAPVHTADGRVIVQASPYDVIAEAYRAKAAIGADGAPWDRAIAHLVDDELRAADGAFRSDHAIGLLRAAIGFALGRLDVYPAGAARTAWLATTLPGELEGALTHPVAVAAGDAIAALSADPAAREALEAWLHGAFADPARFAMLRAALADVVQLGVDDADWVPLAQAAGALGASAVDPQLELLVQLRAAEPGGLVAGVLANLAAPYDPGDPTLAACTAIGGGIAEVDRPVPGAALTGADVGAVLQAVAAFLRAEQHGLADFTAIADGFLPL